MINEPTNLEIVRARLKDGRHIADDKIHHLVAEIDWLRGALKEILENAPKSEPKPDLRSANAFDVEDAGYDQALWQMAEIAREALK